MNPTPSLYQCVVLHEINENRVFQRDGNWWVTGSYRDHKVTMQVGRLLDLGLICPTIMSDGGGNPFMITRKGLQVLDRRPLRELIEKLYG